VASGLQKNINNVRGRGGGDWGGDWGGVGKITF